MNYLVIDLETVVDPTLPPPPKKKDGSEAFPAAPYHQIAVMAAVLLDAHYELQGLCVVGEGLSERDTLVSFVKGLDTHRDTTIVTWNGRGFDLPVIIARCLRHGLAFPWYYAQRDVRYRYSASGHLDVMDFLVDHGAARPYSLDIAAKLIGLPGKLDCKGSDVQEMIDAGQLEEVRAYCMQDVVQTAALFLRAQLLRGHLGAAAYTRAMRGLLAGAGNQPRLAPMLPLIDRARLLPHVEPAPAAPRPAAQVPSRGEECGA